MKRAIFICAAVICVMILSLGFTSCNNNQTSKTGHSLNADLDSLMFSLDGIVYTFPVVISEFEANGWAPCKIENDRDFATYTLEPDDFAIWEFINGELNISVVISNLSEEILPLSESYIAGVAVLYGMHNAHLILPGNIMIVTSYEYVIAAAGNRFSYARETERSIMFVFYIDVDDFTTASFTMTVDNETKQVIFMSMDYFEG